VISILYPLKVYPIYKDYIWGGRNLEKYKQNIPDGIISESWELSCLEENPSIISNGPLSGKKLNDVIFENPNDFLGSNYNGNKNIFPLLFKLIDAEDDLSIQVHPDNEYAYNKENGQYGKTEMWYILDAKPDAKLVLGFDESKKIDDIYNQIKNNQQMGLYKEVNVQKGDIVYIPSGTVHAIKSGLLIAEIQQSSNLTYRIYDYDRVKNGVKRELHVEKALDVIKNSNKSIIHRGLTYIENDILIKILIDCEFFTIKEFNSINKEITINTEDCFNVLMLIEGSCKILYEDNELNLSPIETVFIPANIGSYKLSGTFKILHTSLLKNRESMNIIYKSLGF
jgi:mannose-6-phosphate isomerase